MSIKAISSCDCGYRSPTTTPAMGAYGLRKHSCATTAERAARARRRLDKLAASGPQMPCAHTAPA